MSNLHSEEISQPLKRRRHGDRLDVDKEENALSRIENADIGQSSSKRDRQSGRDRDNDSIRDGEQHANGLLLPPIDHASLAYPQIVRNIYRPLPRLGALQSEAVREELATIGIIATGGRAQAPMSRFEDLALTLPKPLLGLLLTKFSAPTQVQKSIIPTALSGCDIIAVAKTGSGKTLAFVLPLIAHVVAQNRRESGCAGAGPCALVLAPTRELAQQIAQVVRQFGAPVGIGVTCVVGGVAKYEQFKQLRDGGASVFVLTPGRFIDMVRMKACSLNSVSFVVLDEADRMVEAMGFGPQVNTVLSQVRPDAQLVLVSATFPKSMNHLARHYLSDNAVRFVVGNNARDRGAGDVHARIDTGLVGSSTAKQGSAAVALVSEDVNDVFVVVRSEDERFSWLTSRLSSILADGLAIIFCATRGATAALANRLRGRGFATACIHGETDMADRTQLMKMFRQRELRLLCATDVAARGLDVDGVRTVVNFEPANSYEDHIHRSGRTGRAGQKGKAFTLLLPSSPKDIAFARSAVSVLRSAHAPVSENLLTLTSEQRIAGGRRGAKHSRTRRRGGSGLRGRSHV